MWMFATTLRWNIRNSSFEDLQQCLLNAFTRDVSCDRRVFIFATDLIDFIDIDDSLLCPLDVTICGLKQFENNVFDVFSHIPSFGERCGVDDSKRHAQHPSEC